MPREASSTKTETSLARNSIKLITHPQLPKPQFSSNLNKQIGTTKDNS